MLMQEALADPSLISLAAGFVDQESLPDAATAQAVAAGRTVAEHRGGLFTMSPDGRFLAGPVPEVAGLWVASGCIFPWIFMLGGKSFETNKSEPPARVIAMVNEEMREVAIPNVARSPTPSCVLIKFDDGRGKYMEHCHNLVHEDHDMMAQFLVGEDAPECDPIKADRAASNPARPLRDRHDDPDEDHGGGAVHYDRRARG